MIDLDVDRSLHVVVFFARCDSGHSVVELG
jgi:hypothetical protein